MLLRRIATIAKWISVALIAAIILAVLVFDVFGVGSIRLPKRQTVEEVVHLDQGWSAGWKVGETQWFHHANQGTKLLRYDWFMALERPELSVLDPVRSPGAFSSEEYLSRFGFIPSKAFQDLNPGGLPVGFATNQRFQEPFARQPYQEQQDGRDYEYAKKPYAVVGLTCAACHTTELHFQGKGIRIEGGPAMVDLATFKEALGRALFYTQLLPWRFERFSRRVLAEEHNDTNREQLKTELEALVAAGFAEQQYAKQKHLYDLKPGFARTDALGLILNRVFKDLNDENLAVVDAPVNFPHIWDAPWFDWVQYNASIRPPMVRNIGEALGVGGMINLDGTKGQMWRSTVDVENLHLMERQLAGAAPFQGLQSPRWPEHILGNIDRQRLERGKDLYASKCKHCHALMDEAKAALEGDNQAELAKHWTDPNDYGKRFLKTHFDRSGNLERIGTDSAQALNFGRRVVVVVPGQQMMLAGEALDFTTSRVRAQKYAELRLNPQQTIEYDGYRLPWESYLDEPLSKRAERQTPDGPDLRTNASLNVEIPNFKDSNVRLAYKARPLNGIWATGPFLHNGSVPNLYQLLSPVKERDRKFYLGSKGFDPVHVGVNRGWIAGASEFDTSLPGNLNTGHEFRDLSDKEGPNVKGVIGPLLTPDERLAIIEYLKSL